MVSPAPVDKYTGLSRRYIQQAEEEFQRGDLPQTSEKAWGATAESAKSVAAQRGWRHSSHDSLRDVTAQIADERSRPDLRRLFRSAGMLHVNFYEDWMDRRHVRGGMADVRAYMSEMDAVRTAPPSAFVPRTPAQAARLRRLTGTS